MTSTNQIKWDDANNKLTAYCSDDSGETEIGPVKWDDTNNKLELNCDSTDFQAKWNDTTNKLEAQSVSNGCCEEECPTDCSACDSNYDITISGCSSGNCLVLNQTYDASRTDCLWMAVDDYYGTIATLGCSIIGGIRQWTVHAWCVGRPGFVTFRLASSNDCPPTDSYPLVDSEETYCNCASATCVVS